MATMHTEHQLDTFTKVSHWTGNSGREMVRLDQRHGLRVVPVLLSLTMAEWVALRRIAWEVIHGRILVVGSRLTTMPLGNARAGQVMFSIHWSDGVPMVVLHYRQATRVIALELADVERISEALALAWPAPHVTKDGGIHCPRCVSTEHQRRGTRANGGRKMQCKRCRLYFTFHPDMALAPMHGETTAS